ncbi:hypothetical protein D9756_003081 [Leucocoprinus leucothites]|uniref:Uncharacterized protein n=1 Tax=Leucocoprinus leucothites TaxID=201217 RepID=A0A8H5G7L0_9AGAR|nr:hypothetical protein D9756_003081 [Leucoagaricus leucothites]
MVDDFPSILQDQGSASVPAFRHWVHGFTLQTLVYGINTILFLMSLWVLIIHILKGSTGNRFHRHHLLQNCILLIYVMGMFILSSVFMGHQGIMAEDTWTRFLSANSQSSPANVVQQVFSDRAPLQRACNAILNLVNWGTVSLLLWRCALHYKVRSVIPCRVMGVPYLLFASNIATGLLRIINESSPQILPRSAQTKDWALINWGIATALYYLLSILIVARVIYHRHIIGREVGESEIGHFASILTIFYESGAIVLAFSTAYLVVLARFSYLMHIFQSTTVMLSLIIVQRLTVGKAWSGKTIDWLLHSESRHETRHEEVSTMGFNPNAELSGTQNDYTSDNGLDTKGRHDLTMELQEVIRTKV